jgi:hypothetical protein
MTISSSEIGTFNHQEFVREIKDDLVGNLKEYLKAKEKLCLKPQDERIRRG